MSDASDDRTVIDLDDPIDRRAWRCPAGHTQWEPTNEHFYCRTCGATAQQGADVDPSFEHLRDERTGDLVPREAIRLETGVGRWRDLHGGASA
jgi:rubredoxin